MYCGKNGEPLLTKAIERNAGKKEKLLPRIVPILWYLSKDIKLHYLVIWNEMKSTVKVTL